MESGPASPGRRAAAWASHLDQPEARASKDQIVEIPARLRMSKHRWLLGQPAEVKIQPCGIEGRLEIFGESFGPSRRGVLAQALVHVGGWPALGQAGQV